MRSEAGDTVFRAATQADGEAVAALHFERWRAWSGRFADGDRAWERRSTSPPPTRAGASEAG